MDAFPLTWLTVDEVAASLGASEDARRQWRKSGRTVPAAWRIKIAEALETRGMKIPLRSFDLLEVTPGRIAA